jgi:hypothetical protein
MAVADRRDLRLTLDASHYVGQGYAPADWSALLPRVVAVQVRHCRPGELQEPARDEAAIAARLPDLIPVGFPGPVVCEQIANPGDPDWSDQLAHTRRVLTGG